MRYLNWDVLLFPGSSRVPLQEFDTKCLVLYDQNDRFTNSAALNSNPYMSEIESLSHVPILTSFVPSLEQGSPFRVSVHSWEPPKPSEILRTFQSLEETPAYEARIYVDGIMVAHRLLDDRTVWPEVIESTGSADIVHAKPLRFPVFHSEILDQAHWEPGETYGRIRVVIAEGVITQHGNSRSKSTFDRLRDVISFSFQHAPKHILEYSGIAWPNARMFRARPKMDQGNIISRVTILPDFEAHAHSPQRKHSQDVAGKLFGSNAALVANTGLSKNVFDYDDPFVGPAAGSLRQQQPPLRNNNNIASAKEFSSIRTSRSHTLTDMSGVSYAKPNFERSMNEAAIGEIVQALSPERKQELLRALSFGPELPNNGAEIAFCPEVAAEGTDDSTKDQMTADFSLAGLPNSTGNHRPRMSRNNLLASRYASVPLLSPSTLTTRDQRSSFGLRSSMDPLLPTDWNTVLEFKENSMNESKPSSEMRPRSDSNTSKRKRQDSIGNDTTMESFKIMSRMSTSPCKGVSGTPAVSNDISPTTGGVSLSKQRV